MNLYISSKPFKDAAMAGQGMPNTRDEEFMDAIERASRWVDAFVGDQFFPEVKTRYFDGNGRDDLYVVNTSDWATEYLGTLRSTGSNLNGGWQDDWIGSWNLGNVDQLKVFNFNGGSGWEDLVVSNDNWLGLLRSLSGSSSLSAIYPNWIRNHNYHNFGWW